jgi:hypothetical protein
MKILALACLVLLACSDPTAPAPSIDGIYRLESLRYANAYVVQSCPCGGDFRMDFDRGLIEGNGQALTITATLRATGETGRLFAYTLDRGQYTEREDSVVVLGAMGRDVVTWRSGSYGSEDGRLTREVRTAVDTLEAVWVRE